MKEPELRKGFIKMTPEEVREYQKEQEARNVAEMCSQPPAQPLKRGFIKVEPETSSQPLPLPSVLTGSSDGVHQAEPLKRGFIKVEPETISQPLPVLPILASPSAGVYQPEPLNQRPYLIVPKLTIREKAEKLIVAFGLRTKGEEVYLRMKNPDHYKVLEGTDFQLLVDEFFRKQGVFVEPSEIDRIKKMIQYDSRLAVRDVAQLPTNFWPFADGLVDISTGNRMINMAQYFYIHYLRAVYNPMATCPQFEQLLRSCTGGDNMLQELIWRIVGYLLSSDTKAKAFFVFLGPKDTGKSLIAGIVEALLGEDAVTAMGINEIGTRFSMVEMKDKKLAVCMDLGNEPLSASAVGMIKAVTGGDRIRMEAKYQQGVSGKIPARLLFGSNHEIRTKTPDQAFFDRQVVVPFRYPVPKEKQDRGLLDKIIRTELPGIAVRAAAAYLRLVQSNYQFPDASAMLPSVAEINHEKVIVEFAARCCTFSEQGKISTEELYNVYRRFASKNGLPALEKTEFSAAFNRLNSQVEKKKINFSGKSLQGYVGVSLKIPEVV